MRHEQWAHRQRIWRCPDHPQLEYASRLAYENNVEMQHAESKLLLLSSELLTAQESVSPTIDRRCPFCHRGYEDTLEMQQHVASYLEAVARLSLPNLDEEKMSAKGNSNSANSNHTKSKAGEFDFTEKLLLSENEDADEPRSSSEAEKVAFRTKLEIVSQSCHDASNEFVINSSRNCEQLVRDWLDGVSAEWSASSQLDLTRHVVDTYSQLARFLRLISRDQDPNEHLLWAVVTFLKDVLQDSPVDQQGRRRAIGPSYGTSKLELALCRMETGLESLVAAPSDGLAVFVDRSDDVTTRETRISIDNSHGRSAIINAIFNKRCRGARCHQGPVDHWYCK